VCSVLYWLIGDALLMYSGAINVRNMLSIEEVKIKLIK